MRPQVNQEELLTIFRNASRKWAYHPNIVLSRENTADDAGYEGTTSHHEEEPQDGAAKVDPLQFRSLARAGCDGEQDPKWKTNPPRGDDTPAEREESRRLGWEEWRVADREVLDTDACRHLIVRNSVRDRREDRQRDNAKRFHISEVARLPRLANAFS